MVFKYPAGLTLINPLKKLRKKELSKHNSESQLLLNKDQVTQFNESLIDTAVRNFGLTSIVSTQDAFYKRTGKVFVDDPFYDIRVSYFFDILIYGDISRYHKDFEQKIQPHHNLFEFLIAQEKDSQNQATSANSNMQTYPSPIHSIYKVLSVQDLKLQVKDCFSKKAYTLLNQKDQLFTGIARGSYIQGFIFNCKEGFTTSVGIIVHPKKCNPMIRQAISSYKSHKQTDPKALLDRLAFAQLQQYRMKHVNPSQIYKGILLEGNRPSLS